MKRLPLTILLLLCAVSACDNIADITSPTIPTPAPDPVTPPQPDPPAPEPLPELEPPAPEPEPVPEPPAPDPVPEPPAPYPAPEPPVPAEVSPLDPMILMAEWQPRFKTLGFRLEVGPGEPLPTITNPDQHRWSIGMYAAGDVWPRLYYAVFAPAQGSEEALSSATSLLRSYMEKAAQISAIEPRQR